MPLGLLHALYECCRVFAMGVPLLARHRWKLKSGGMSLHECQDRNRQEGKLERDHDCCTLSEGGSMFVDRAWYMQNQARILATL